MNRIRFCVVISGFANRVSTMNGTIVETEVTYSVEKDGQFFLIEKVPARVCQETGEQFFSPGTVDQIQRIIKSRKKPERTVQTPVYEFG
jgi:YgiT-type zinc finger domain-containing protein